MDASQRIYFFRKIIRIVARFRIKICIHALKIAGDVILANECFNLVYGSAIGFCRKQCIHLTKISNDLVISSVKNLSQMRRRKSGFTHGDLSIVNDYNTLSGALEQQPRSQSCDATPDDCNVSIYISSLRGKFGCARCFDPDRFVFHFIILCR